MRLIAGSATIMTRHQLCTGHRVMEMRTARQTYHEKNEFKFRHFILAVVLGLGIFALWLYFFKGIQWITWIFPGVMR
jgi:hypothetical protein